MIPGVERQFVEAFVKPELRERYSLPLGGKGRNKQLRRLYHHFDVVADKSEKLKVREGDDMSVLAHVRAGGARGVCHVISVNDDPQRRTGDNSGQGCR